MFATAVILFTFAAITASAAGSPSDEYARAWSGRRVVVKSALYTVLYDEVGRIGLHYNGKLAGLTVVTRDSEYYEFDAPGSDNDIVEPTPNRVFNQMSERFHRAYYLDIGTVQTITPLLLRQYDPGALLVVDSVKVERTRLRLALRDVDGFATSLTVKWHVPFSKHFAEREEIDALIRRFLEPL